MKKWNVPEIEALDLGKTENGFPWFHEERIDCVAKGIGSFFGVKPPKSLGEVPAPSTPVVTPGESESKGDQPITSGTGDVNAAS